MLGIVDDSELFRSEFAPFWAMGIGLLLVCCSGQETMIRVMSEEDPEQVAVASLGDRPMRSNWHLEIGEHLALYNHAYLSEEDIFFGEATYYPVLPKGHPYVKALADGTVGDLSVVEEFPGMVRTTRFGSEREIPRQPRWEKGGLEGVLIHHVSAYPDQARREVEDSLKDGASFRWRARRHKLWVLNEDHEHWPLWKSLGATVLGVILMAFGVYLYRRQHGDLSGRPKRALPDPASTYASSPTTPQ